MSSMAMSNIVKRNSVYLNALRCYCNKPSTTSSEPAKIAPQKYDPVTGKPILGKFFEPSVLDRRFLVWSGHYKSQAEIPEQVSGQILDASRTKARIRISIISMIATLFGCALMVYSGKQAAARGETVHEQNLQWHKEIAEGKRKY